MLPTRGSEGLQSVNNEHIDSKTFDIVRAGLQLSFKMSRHITPLLFMLQWYIRVLNVTWKRQHNFTEVQKTLTNTLYFKKIYTCDTYFKTSELDVKFKLICTKFKPIKRMIKSNKL